MQLIVAQLYPERTDTLNQATLHSIEYYAKLGDAPMREYIDKTFGAAEVRIIILFYIGVFLPITMADYHAMTTYKKLEAHDRICSIWAAQDSHRLRRGIIGLTRLIGS